MDEGLRWETAGSKVAVTVERFAEGEDAFFRTDGSGAPEIVSRCLLDKYPNS